MVCTCSYVCSGGMVDDCQSFVRESLTKTSRDGVARGLTIDREISKTGFQPVFCKQTGWKPFLYPTSHLVKSGKCLDDHVEASHASPNRLRKHQRGQVSFGPLGRNRNSSRRCQCIAFCNQVKCPTVYREEFFTVLPTGAILRCLSLKTGAVQLSGLNQCPASADC